VSRRASPSDCQSCLHYRPQSSFVDAYKDFDRSAPREPVMKSLLELRKEETRLQENEMELQVELMMTDQIAWPSRPRFAPLCVFGDGLFIPAAKNPDGRCADFSAAVNRQGQACGSCQFVVRPETKIGDRRRMPSGAGGSQETAFYRQLNKEQDDADATAQALEIEQAYVGEGALSGAYFLPTCAVRITAGRQNVTPFCNLRNDCALHSAHVALPGALVDWIRATASEPDAEALTQTVKIAKLIAGRDINRPAEFLADLAAWVREDSGQRWSAALWAFSCVYGRWTAEAPKDGSVTKPPPYRAGDPMPPTWGAAPATPPPALMPFIAGCDAYEWGLLAAFSRTSDDHATSAAALLCQQVAEFLVTAISPFEAAAAIDAVLALTDRRDACFAPRTLDLVDGFLQRLRGRAETLRLAARTDLQQQLESFARALSHKMESWSALPSRTPSQLASLDSIDTEVGDKLRQLDRARLTAARLEGRQILEAAAGVATGALSRQERSAWPAKLKAANESASERDEADDVEVFGDALNAYLARMEKSVPGYVATFFDRPVGDNQLTGRALVQNAFRQTLGLVYNVARASKKARREVSATLFFLRGIEPVTLTALELLRRQPQPDRLPESVEQALSSPVATTLEAFHATRWRPPEIARNYLAAGRRIAAPRFSGDATARAR
jgi:hypothetical protein